MLLFEMSYNSAVQRYGKKLVQQILNLKYPSSDKYIEFICRYVVNEKKDVQDVCRMFRSYDMLHQRNGLTIDFRNISFDDAQKIIEEEDSDIIPALNSLSSLQVTISPTDIRNMWANR